jgi:hypothetical protein
MATGQRVDPLVAVFEDALHLFLSVDAASLGAASCPEHIVDTTIRIDNQNEGFIYLISEVPLTHGYSTFGE